MAARPRVCKAASASQAWDSHCGLYLLSHCGLEQSPPGLWWTSLLVGSRLSAPGHMQLPQEQDIKP